MKRYKTVIELWLLVIVSIFILVFYVWSACSNKKSFNFTNKIGHYNYLTDAFLAGQLNFLINPPPELLALPDPFDPQKNEHLRLHDASLYNGKYYTYFGPAPVLTLYIPYQVITGKKMSNQMATTLYLMGIFLVGTLFLYKVRQMIFPNSKFWILIAGVIAFGMLNPFGYLLRGDGVYEVAIGSGCFWFLLCGYLMFYSLINIKTKGITTWRAIVLAVATICYGLAVASRPNYSLSVIIFLLPLYQAWRNGSKRRDLLKVILSIGLPLCIFVCLLSLYNYLRFDNIFEFGATNALVGDPADQRINRWSIFNVLYNAYLYFLLPVIPDHIFPFFHLTIQSDWNTTPSFLDHIPQYYGPEPVMGILSNVPFVFGIILFLKLIVSKKTEKNKHLLLLNLMFLLLIPSGINITILLFFSAASMRYLIDFLPYILLLSIVGWSVYLDKIFTYTFPRKIIVSFSFVALFCWSVILNIGISLTGSHNNLIRQNENLFRKIENFFTPISSLYHRFNLEKYGGINLQIQFPPKNSGMETIAVVWPWTGEDVVLVHYRKKNEIMLAFYSLSNDQIFWSRPLIIDYSQTYEMNIHLGSLYPKPSNHLLLLGYNPERYSKLKISLNGIVIMEQTIKFQESHPKSVYVGMGNSRVRTTFPWFSGDIIKLKRLPLF